MAKLEFTPANEGNEYTMLDGQVTLTLTPQEAHAVYLALGRVTGDNSTTIRAYTDRVYTALERLRFMKYYEISAKENVLVFTGNLVANTLPNKSILGFAHS